MREIFKIRLRDEIFKITRDFDISLVITREISTSQTIYSAESGNIEKDINTRSTSPPPSAHSLEGSTHSYRRKLFSILVKKYAELIQIISTLYCSLKKGLQIGFFYFSENKRKHFYILPQRSSAYVCAFACVWSSVVTGNNIRKVR